MIQDATHFLEEDNVSGGTLTEKTTLLAARIYSRDQRTFKASKGALHRIVLFHFKIRLDVKGMCIAGELRFKKKFFLLGCLTLLFRNTFGKHAQPTS